MKSIIYCIIFCYALGSCATAYQGRTTRFNFSSQDSTQVQVYMDSIYIGLAPGKIKVPTKNVQHGSVIELRAENESQFFEIERKLDYKFVFADMFLGGVWLAIDVGTGHIYAPSPLKIDYSLTKPQNIEAR